MSDFPIEAVMVVGCAFSFILAPMLWNAHCNKQEERKRKCEQQRELTNYKARERQIALKNIVEKLESNRRCLSRTRLYLADIRAELRVYEMETRRKSILEKDKYESIRLGRLANNVEYLCGKMGELEESLEDLKCQLCRYECGMIRNANQ